MSVLVALMVMVRLLSGQVYAQQEQAKSHSIDVDRVEVIMERLPPRGTPEYRTLVAQAGEPKVQVLSLTKSEMWLISRSRLTGLQQAAAVKNIGVRVVDQSSWNEMFQGGVDTGQMDAKAKLMMDQAMQSKSTTGMGMMAPRATNLVEYALTKGMNEKPANARPVSIKIAVNDLVTITAIRNHVVIEGDRCIWRGVVEGTEQPVTIMWWASGRITGTIHYGNRLYQLKHLGADVIGVVETMMDRLPDEHAPASPKRMQEMNVQQDPLVTQGDSSSMRPKRNENDDTKDARDNAVKGIRTAVINPKHKKALNKPAAGSTGKGAPKIVIDVMVAYTAKAAAHYSDIRRDLIELAIEETNQSFKASKIDGIAVRLVQTHETDYKEDGAEHFDHVWRMVDKGDGFMEEIPKLREEKKADVVILVVDDPSGCGLATRVAAEADEAYAVVHHECAATSYSVAHEIGHIIGARHDRSLDKNVAPFAYGHGFVSPDLKWRTMMSYKAGCNNCPRLLIWSTPEKVKGGLPAGDAENNNARVIREQAARVASFR